MFRSVCGGGKGGGSSYDPQVGAATSANAAVAAKAEDFSEAYYTNVITPLLQDQSALSHTMVDSANKLSERQLSLSEQQQELSKRNSDAALDTQGKLNNLYDLNADQMKKASDRYDKFGVPAEENYYNMVRDYSSAGEEEKQARLAKGDAGLAAANQKGAFMRSLSGLGISATSPAAVSAMSDMAVQNAALEAGAATRARGAAKALGMTLTSDAANYGRGGTSSTLAFGGAAQGNTTGAFGVANSAFGSGSNALQAGTGAFGTTMGGISGLNNTLLNGGNGVLTGYKTASDAYGNNADAYSKLGSADIQARAANDPMAGIGKLAGTLGSAWIASDRRLKENVTPIGHYANGLTKYTFNFIGQAKKHVGAIAQEVLHKLPKAVRVGANGFYEVNYAELH